ncbi:MAG: hypothetical protein OXE86_13545 [Alphaproteobacteria bacterium]|nr:hypothetical protein [Alphaproteobacteria bacterium]
MSIEGKDAAALAGISKVSGKHTRGTGARAREGAAIKRLSNPFTIAVGLIAALAGQLAVLATSICLHLVRRIIDPDREHVERPDSDDRKRKTGL